MKFEEQLKQFKEIKKIIIEKALNNVICYIIFKTAYNR